MAYMNPTAKLGGNTPQTLALMNSFIPKPQGQTRGINLPPGTPVGGVPLNQQRDQTTKHHHRRKTTEASRKVHIPRRNNEPERIYY